MTPAGWANGGFGDTAFMAQGWKVIVPGQP
jgi:hypothetical protein